MQKTYLSLSLILAAIAALLGLRVQLSHASAGSIEDPALSLPAASIVISDATGSVVQQDPTSTAVVLPASDEPPAPFVETAAKEKDDTAVTIKAAAAVEVTSAPQKPMTMGTPQQYPERLIIPSLNINVPIQPVGVNAKGEMDVPSGNSNNVGWYKYGTMPGNIGSAVLDAHVFAAFKNLRYLKVGEDILIQTEGGTKLRFRVVDSRVYKLSELTPAMLFGRNDARRLNLITCAGTYVPSMGTYDHRLVDYAIFVGEEA